MNKTAAEGLMMSIIILLLIVVGVGLFYIIYQSVQEQFDTEEQLCDNTELVVVKAVPDANPANYLLVEIERVVGSEDLEAIDFYLGEKKIDLGGSGSKFPADSGLGVDNGLRIVPNYWPKQGEKINYILNVTNIDGVAVDVEGEKVGVAAVFAKEGGGLVECDVSGLRPVSRPNAVLFDDVF